MTSRTLFLAALVLLAVPVGAYAQTTTVTTNASRPSSLSKSDEDYLSEMPVKKFPGAAEMADKDHDGIVDSEQKGGIADPFSATSTQPEKPKVTYTYKPQSSTVLRRSIQDDRIEDGYVQGYMQQNGPQN